jgi:hypothetical protein
MQKKFKTIKGKTPKDEKIKIKENKMGKAK